MRKRSLLLFLIVFPFFAQALQNNYLLKPPPPDYVKTYRALYFNWLKTELNLKNPDPSCFSDWEQKAKPAFDFFPNSITSFFVEYRAGNEIESQWLYTLLSPKALSCFRDGALGARWSFEGQLIAKFYSTPPSGRTCPQKDPSDSSLFEVLLKDKSCRLWNLKPKSSSLSILEERFVVKSYLELKTLTSVKKLYFIKTSWSLDWPWFPSNGAYKIKKDWRKLATGISIDEEQSYTLYWF